MRNDAGETYKNSCIVDVHLAFRALLRIFSVLRTSAVKQPGLPGLYEAAHEPNRSS